MGEDRNKSDEDRFEENLRQILTNAPSGGATPGPEAGLRAHTESGAREAADKAEADQKKAFFWLKLIRPLAALVFLAFLAIFVLRITAER